jgi:hypothetical protein
VDGQAECLGQPGRLAADAAIAPQADDPAADLLLEAGAPVPAPLLLVAGHGAQVAGQVDHHGQVPLGDGRVEDAPGVAHAQRPVGQPQVPEVLVTDGAELEDLQVGQVGQVARGVLAQQYFRPASQVIAHDPVAPVGLHHPHGNRRQRLQAPYGGLVHGHREQDASHDQDLTTRRGPGRTPPGVLRGRR